MRFCDPKHEDTIPGELPWWCLLHYLVCAESVIMLEIVHKTAATKNIGSDPATLLHEAGRPMPWLRRASATDLAARRTYTQLSELLGQVADGAELTKRQGRRRNPLSPCG